MTFIQNTAEIQNIWLFLMFDWDEVFKKHFKLLEHSDFQIFYGGKDGACPLFSLSPWRQCTKSSPCVNLVQKANASLHGFHIAGRRRYPPRPIQLLEWTILAIHGTYQFHQRPSTDSWQWKMLPTVHHTLAIPEKENQLILKTSIVSSWKFMERLEPTHLWTKISHPSKLMILPPPFLSLHVHIIAFLLTLEPDYSVQVLGFNFVKRRNPVLCIRKNLLET